MPILIVGGQAAPTRPPAPNITAVTPGDTTLRVRWFATGDGRSALLRFVVTVRLLVNGTVVKVQQTGDAATTQLLVTGLTNNAAYVVTVQAVNAIGTSDELTSVQSSPTAAPVEPDPDPEAPGEEPEEPPTAPPVTIPQPLFYAFPPERAFRPEHWMLTPEQADAL